MMLVVAGCGREADVKNPAVGFEIVVDHAIQRDLEIVIALDGEKIFNGVVKAQQQKPPLVWSKVIPRKMAARNIRFEDMSRKIVEEKTFNDSTTKVILLRTRKDDVRGEHIIVSKERIPFK